MMLDWRGSAWPSERVRGCEGTGRPHPTPHTVLLRVSTGTNQQILILLTHRFAQTNTAQLNQSLGVSYFPTLNNKFKQNANSFSRYACRRQPHILRRLQSEKFIETNLPNLPSNLRANLGQAGELQVIGLLSNKSKNYHIRSLSIVNLAFVGLAKSAQLPN